MNELVHIHGNGYICTHNESDISVYARSNRYDPTHTTALRGAFAADMKRRFNELISVIIKSVKVNDAFGLLLPSLVLHQMTPAPNNAFNFARSSEKVEAFMKWLREQVDKGLLTVKQYEQIGTSVEVAWTNMYILDSYKRGIIRARDEMRKAGLNIPAFDILGGIGAYLAGTPFHMDRVGLLFTRVYTDLQGITSAMDTIISRILAQGMADGDGPALIARKLVAAINGTGVGDLGLTIITGRFIPAKTRAIILARTEIIRAHHLAMIQEYRNWGVLNIKILAEWATAGDDRVCSICEDLNGKIFTLDEIENMIPRHPQCRCVALPFIEELIPYYNN